MVAIADMYMGLIDKLFWETDMTCFNKQGMACISSAMPCFR